MSVLEKLELTEKTRSGMLVSPVSRARVKMLDAIDHQIAGAKAAANGETYYRQGKRWVTDPETGERVHREVQLPFRPWWWKDENGQVMLEVRYGAKRIEIEPKKPSIAVGEESNLIPVLETLKEAVQNGELDGQLSSIRRRGKKGSAK